MTHALPLDLVTVTAFLLNLILQLTIIGLSLLVTARWVFRNYPSVRYFVCLGGIMGALLSPLGICLQYGTGYGLVTLSLPLDISSSPASAALISPALVVDTGTNTAAREVSARRRWITWGMWAVFSAWAAGIAWGALRLVHGGREVSRLTRSVTGWTAPASVETLDQVVRELGGPLPPVFLSPLIASPVALGLFRPMVILPEGLAETLPPSQLRHVLLHECAHVAYRHTFGGMAERVAGLLYWPHPLVHALCRELARAREEVCDNVASREDGAACYARTLLAIAQGMITAPSVTSELAFLGPGTRLEDRIAGLLDPRRNRMVSMKRWKSWAITCMVVITMGSAVVVRVVSAETKGEAKETKMAAEPHMVKHTANLSESEESAARRKAEEESASKLHASESPDRLTELENEAKLKEEAAKLKAEVTSGRLKPEAAEAKLKADAAKLKAETEKKQANGSAGSRTVSHAAHAPDSKKLASK